MIVYAMMSMIGIAIGIAVTTSVEDNTFAYMITVGVLQVDKYETSVNCHLDLHYSENVMSSILVKFM